MNKYQLIISEFEKIENWKNEELFLVHALVISNAKLFQKSYLELLSKYIH